MRTVVVHEILLFVHDDTVQEVSKVGRCILEGVQMRLSLFIGLECLDDGRYEEGDLFFADEHIRHLLQLRRLLVIAVST